MKHFTEHIMHKNIGNICRCLFEASSVRLMLEDLFTLPSEPDIKVVADQGTRVHGL